MAIYSMNINIVSRGKGSSAVAAAAYRAGETIRNEYDGTLHDYSRKSGIVHTSILLPADAPGEYCDRSALWNAVEKTEKAKNAQLAREVRVALPAELSLGENIDLVREYARANFVRHGMIADVCIHDRGDGNPHAHILLTMRPIGRGGNWAAKSRMEYILDASGGRTRLPSGRYKTRKVNATDWDGRGRAEEWRAAWADAVNRHLELSGHESRIDHRSYERQGTGQIPTVHLGAAANDMEKNGIPTERGDINRRIKKANARLKDLGRQIHEIQNPAAPQMIIDLEKSIKAQGSPGYAHWCKIFNLKQAAQTLIYIQDSGLADIASLAAARRNAAGDVDGLRDRIERNREKIKSLGALRTQANNYRDTLEAYKTYNAPGQMAVFKKDYYNRHKDAIDKHMRARAYIFDELKLEKFPSLKKLGGDIGGLHEKNMALQRELKAARQRAVALANAEHNIRMLLGYRELESAGYTPTIPADDLRFSEPYEPSFIEAEQSGETEAYFRSRAIDHECAEDILRASSNMADHEPAAEGILAKYGKGRAERVVAAMVNSAPADRYPEHREWASRVGGSGISPEPSALNTEIYQRHEAINVFHFFIRTFRRVADSMVNAIFTVSGKDGGKISKSGWAHPKEIAKSKPEGKNWDEGLSARQRLAIAQQLADEHNRAIHESSPRKTQKTTDHHL